MKSKFISEFNGKRIAELDDVNKKNILKIFDEKTSNNKIKCFKMPNNEKANICIELDGIQKYIFEINKESKHIHIEKLSSFVNFLKKINIPNKCICDYVYYHYGDGTYNGTGAVRYDSEFINKRMIDKIQIMNDEFNKDEVIKKFFFHVMMKDFDSNHQTDFIYYDNDENKYLFSVNEAIKHLFNNKCMSYKLPHCSSFSIQPLSRDLSFKNTNKRDYVLVKWKCIDEDFLSIKKDRESTLS